MEVTIKIENPYGFIYITTNMINGKKYIGKRKFYVNWQYYIGSGKLLGYAIKKYGRKNFSREIIAIAYSKEELNQLEIEFIKEHDAVESEDYYNITCGGNGGQDGISPSKETRIKISNSLKGRTVSEETKLKISESEKGEKNWNYGRPMPEELKQKIRLLKIGKPLSIEQKTKISLANKGRVCSEETRRKISLANKGKKGRLGVHFSDETRKKMSLAYKEIKLNKDQLKEIRQKYKTGKYTQRGLAKEYAISPTTINRIINLQRGYKNIDKYK